MTTAEEPSNSQRKPAGRQQRQRLKKTRRMHKKGVINKDNINISISNKMLKNMAKDGKINSLALAVMHISVSVPSYYRLINIAKDWPF